MIEIQAHPGSEFPVAKKHHHKTLERLSVGLRTNGRSMIEWVNTEEEGRWCILKVTYDIEKGAGTKVEGVAPEFGTESPEELERNREYAQRVEDLLREPFMKHLRP